MEDKEIIELFFSRSEAAIAETGAKYGRLCRKVSFGILGNEEDTEECINSAYQKLWDTIPPKRPDSLCGYLCKVVRNIALNIARAAKRRGGDFRGELNEILPEKNTLESVYDSRETARFINSFLSETGKKNRQIFTARYYFGMSVKSIGESFGMSETAVKSRLSRIRSELRKYLSERGVEV